MIDARRVIARRSGAANALGWSFAWLAALLAGVLTAACSAESDPPHVNNPASGAGSQACLAGEVRGCPCTGGSQGVQSCLLNGAGFDACMCPGANVALPVGGSPPLVSGQAGSAGSISVPTAGASGTPAVPTAGTNGTTVTPPEVMPGEAPLAHDVRIKEVAIYQAVKVSLAADGEAVVARNAPVIVGKEALLRVFVEPLAGWSARDLDVELSLVSSEGPAKPQTVTARVSAASSDAMLESTVNFDIPADQITPDVQYSVALHEHAGANAMGTVDPAARFPKDAGSLIALGARDAGPLHIMLVPYRYQGDSSGRLPATDKTQLDLFQAILHAYYPANDIQIEVHAPVDYTAAVGPNTGWEQWLETHCALRTQEDMDPKLLYYGVMSPRDSLRAYGSGIVGISNLPGPASNYGRCSVGVGWSGNIAATTMAHELGHSLGLPHAPCGVDGGPFPYAEAKIGVWGYSLSSKMLRDPDKYYDLMSYCDPSFISDYNFEKIFERIRYLNLQFDVLDPLPMRYARVLVDRHGNVSMRGHSLLKRAPGGVEEQRPVTVLDASGVAMPGARTGYYFPFSEAGAGVWLVPDDGATAVELDGVGRVELR